MMTTRNDLSCKPLLSFPSCFKDVNTLFSRGSLTFKLNPQDLEPRLYPLDELQHYFVMRLVVSRRDKRDNPSTAFPNLSNRDCTIYTNLERRSRLSKTPPRLATAHPPRDLENTVRRKAIRRRERLQRRGAQNKR